MDFNARFFKEAWNRARLGSSKDKTRPGLSGMNVEIFDGYGLRVVTTDSYSLVVTHIPCVEPTAPRPELADVSKQTFHVYDPANQLVAPCAGATKDHVVTLAVVAGSLTTTSTHRAGRITGTVHCLDSDFPSWRGLWPNSLPTGDGEAFTLAPDRLATACRIMAPYDRYVVGKMTFHATTPMKPIVITNRGGELFPHEVLIMPIRLK